MENMPESTKENFDKERAVCSSYDLLVNELSARMVIDTKKYLPVKEGEFDHEDILSWVSAVDFKDGETPDVGVDIRDSKNESLMKFEARDVEVIKGKDVLASNESILYSMALAEAKMKKIAEIAEDTYPAIAFQIAEIRDEYKDVREELLKEDEPETTLVESFGKVAARRKFLYGTLVVMGIVLVACAAYESTKDVGTGTSTSEPPAVETTEAPTPTMEATKTMEPTPTATEAVETEAALVEWDKMELNIGGRPMEFVIGMEKGADITNKWGITKMEINDNLVDAEKKLSNLVGASFWQMYVLQSGEQVSYEEFSATPEKYKINLVTPDGDGGYKNTEFSFDQIKKFERRFVGKNDERLFFDVDTATYVMPESKGTDQYCGYEFTEDGQFIVYETLGVSGQMLDIILSEDYPMSTDVSTEYFAGDIVGSNIINELFGVVFSSDQKATGEIKDHKGVYLLKFYPAILETSSSPNFDEMVEKTGGSSDKNAADYYTNYGFWKIDLPNIK